MNTKWTKSTNYPGYEEAMIGGHLCTRPMGHTFVDTAREIATLAHRGQYRRHKDGRPSNVAYTIHCERVARHFEDDPEAQALAWLHDVLEDCPEWTPEMLLSRGIPKHIVQACVDMKKTKGEHYIESYLDRVWGNPLCRRVKIRDVIDNLADDPTDEQIEKYARALQYLVL